MVQGRSGGAVVRVLYCKPPDSQFESDSYLCLWDVSLAAIPWPHVPGVTSADAKQT